MLDDTELLRRYAREHSDRDFAELVRRHLNLVYAVACRQVGGDVHLAEDVAQQVFVALARKAAAVADRPSLSGWLYRSTHFAASDAVRSERRRRAREQEAQFMDQGEMPTAVGDGGNTVDWERVRPTIDEAIAELNEADRDAVSLRFLDGHSFAEVGRRLRVTENAARMRVTRALDKLHAALARRGVRSTAAALGLALTQQAAVSAPAGLARVITENAVGVAAGGAAGVFNGMMAGKWAASVATGVTAVSLSLLALQDTTRADGPVATAPAATRFSPVGGPLGEGRMPGRERSARTATASTPPSGEASKPSGDAVRVTLHSDGETWVSITNVRVPEKVVGAVTVTLPPGTYRIVGRRKGYRDVERTVQIRPGESVPPIRVVCTETSGR